MPLNSELSAIITRIPAWAGVENIQVERIAGLTNTNYRVEVNSERFVLRVSGQNTQHLGINRQHEFTALTNAAALGLAPEVFAFLLPEGHLVTRWIDGRHWEPGEYRTPENIYLLTETVKRVHRMPPNGSLFSPFRRIEAYIETARHCSVPFPADFERFLETMHDIEAEQQRDRSDWRHFCHNDLVSVNYLYCDTSPVGSDRCIKILDWEFAGLGDIYYDLATLVYTHDSEGPIPQELEEVMLDCYFGQVTRQQIQRLNGMKYMLMFFTGMWGLAQHGMQTAGLIPPVEGFDYLEFAQHLFDHEIRKLLRGVGQ